MKLRPTSLPLQILAFLVLPIFVLLVLIAFGSVALHQTEMRDLLANHNMKVVPGTASNLGDQLQQRQAILSALAESGQTPQSVIETSQGWLETLFDGGVAYYGPDGEAIAASTPFTDWALVWSQFAPASGLSNPQQMMIVPFFDVSKNTTWIAIRALGWSQSRETNKAVGFYVTGVVSLQMPGISSLLSGLHTSENTTVYLLATDGFVLYDSRSMVLGEVIPTMSDLESGVNYRTNSEGQDVVSIVARVPNTDWQLVQEEQWQATLDPMTRYSQATPLVLVPGLLIAIGVVWFGIQRIVVPLQRLETQATNLTWGDYAAIEQSVGGIEEIKRLQITLRHMAARIKTDQAGMRNYIAAVTHAQEDERTRLAHELHDQTSQSLVALDHRQQMLKSHVSNNPEAAALLAENRKMIAQIIDDLRRIVRAMRPIYLEELGLMPALEMLARDLNLDESVQIHFEKHGTPQRLSDEQEIALYRVAQEALNNAWQHSEADSVWLSIRFEKTDVSITVRDNGKGFAAPQYTTDLTQVSEGHFGIVGMYERASLIGAHLQIQSESGNGTTVKIRTPLSSNNAEG